MSLPVTLGDGTAAEALCFSNGQITVRAPGAFAPGQPMDFNVQLESGLSLKGRCGGSKRQADGSFVVRARLVNLTRVARETLEAALPAAI